MRTSSSTINAHRVSNKRYQNISTNDGKMSQDLNVRQMFGVLQRRKWVVFVAILTITSLVITWSFLVTPEYTASIKVILDGKEQNALDIANPASQGSKDDAMIVTEVERIRSRSLAQTVVEKLHLEDDPEFNARLMTPSWVESAYLRGREILLSVIQPGTPVKPDNGRDRIIGEFSRRLRVDAVGKSRAILIYFTSRNPEKAAAIANMLGDEYLFANLRKRSETADRAHEWLAERLQGLRQGAQESETVVENYRKQHGLFQGERVALLTEQMSDMNKRRLEAESARQAAEAKLAQARRLFRSPDKLEAAEEVFESDLVQKLRSEEAALSSKEAAFAQQYGPLHPAMIQIREERKKFASEIDREINRIIARLQNELDVAMRQEASITSGMGVLKRQIEEANEASVGLRSLEREADARRSLLEKALGSYMETSAQNTSAQLPDVSIVSTAAIPEQPSFPRRGVVIAAAAALSGMVGVFLAFFIEGIDVSFRSAEQVERETGLKVLAHVPAVKTTKADCLSSLALEPNSAFAEAMRSIFIRLLMPRESMSPPRRVLVTSTQPKEGKSTIAMSLAKLLAGTGLRVLLLDLDFSRSNSDVGSNTASLSIGLGQVLEGKADIGDVIHKVNNFGELAVVSAGTFSTYDILSVDRLNSLLQQLESDFDTIVLDSPPVLVAAVTQRIATLVDSIVYVVRWGHTTREVVKYAVKRLKDCRVDDMGGIVLSMVDIRVNNLYFRGDSTYYTGTNHSKGMSIIQHLAAHKGVPAIIAAMGVLLAVGAAVERESGTNWLESKWQVQRREMLPGGGEANRLPGSVPAGGAGGSYTSPALERLQEVRSTPEEAAIGPEHKGTPIVESTAMIAHPPSTGPSVLPDSVLRKETDASNALISAVEQPTQSAPTQPAGTPTEKAMPGAWVEGE
jgi:polysaccharide biosynthesis transport protein